MTYQHCENIQNKEISFSVTLKKVPSCLDSGETHTGISGVASLLCSIKENGLMWSTAMETQLRGHRSHGFLEARGTNCSNGAICIWNKIIIFVDGVMKLGYQ